MKSRLDTSAIRPGGRVGSMNAPENGEPISKFLNPDGTLKKNPGVKGTIDPRGFMMTTDGNGAPRFVPSEELKNSQRNISATPIPGWSSAFGYNDEGVEGNVDAVAVIGANIFVGGTLTAVKGAVVSGVAMWNGASWSDVGGGVNGAVTAMTAVGDSLFVGGFFVTAGGVSVNKLALWDGTSWHDVGGGFTDPGAYLFTLAFSNGTLYVGGSFQHAGGIPANNIAAWNGSVWNSFSAGTDGIVETIAARNDTVYAGGYFFHAGGISAPGIARWDGSAWSCPGGAGAAGGFGQGVVYSLAFAGNLLYAGGQFDTIGGVPASGIASWDGAAWSPLAGGLNLYGGATSMTADGSNLYVGGSFYAVDTIPVQNLAMWDGANWHDVGGGLGRSPASMAIEHNGPNHFVCIGGNIGTAGGIAVNGITTWDLVEFRALYAPDGPNQNGTNSNVLALASDGVNLYAGGVFTKAGGGPARGIARWNGTTWTDMGDDEVFAVNALTFYHDTLYAGGDFDFYGADTGLNVARWNGSHWSALGSGVDGSVMALLADSANLYVGGTFTMADGAPANNIAVWNGASWSTLGDGVAGSLASGAGVRAIAKVGAYIYVGGNFVLAGAAPVSNLAKWDGAAWTDVGGGTSGPYISALAAVGSDLYVGGPFYEVGGSENIPHLARWDGTQWHTVGASSYPYPVSALAASGDSLYLGSAYGGAVQMWDGANFSDLANDLNGNVYALANTVQGLYVGGYFGELEGIASANIANFPGAPYPVLQKSTASIAFPTLTIGDFYSVHVQIKDVGAGLLNVTSIRTADSTNFSIQGIKSIHLYGGMDTTFYVEFSPQSQGSFSTYAIITSNAASSPDTIRMSASAVSFQTQVTLKANWNLVAAPLQPQPDDSVKHVFGALQEFPYAFAYTGSGYTQSYVTAQHVGYWQKFFSSSIVTLNGGDYSQYDTIPVNAGWNLIGAPAYPLPASYPVGLGTTITSKFYGFNGGYTPEEDSLRPGRGYWVNVTSGGSLWMYATRNTPKTSPKKSPTLSPLTSLSTLVIADGAGGKQTLYFGAKEKSTIDANTYLLPPVPPAGIFDARFASQRAVELNGTSSGNFPIVISSAAYPLTISWNIAAADQQAYSLVDAAGKVLEATLVGRGSVKILDSRLTQLSLLVSGSVPRAFALKQNYPNPFNPTTMIQFDLPVQSVVTLKVYDLLGREVAALADREQMSAGRHEVQFFASSYASGVYYYKITANGGAFVAEKKMVLLR